MASTIDPELSKKQQLFVNNILEKGLAPMAFVDHLNTKKPGKGQDLTNFTVDEIQQYIDEFTQNPVMKAPPKKVEKSDQNIDSDVPKPPDPSEWLK